MKKLICLVLAVMLILSAISAFAAEYKDKETVKKVQQALNDAGYNCGTPDGSAGKKTKAAIKDYQSDNGLESTGVIDDELLSKLGLIDNPASDTLTADKPANDATDTDKEKIVDIDAGTLVIKGYELIPHGFKGFSNTHDYDNFSIFTVHTTITVKGDEPESSWGTFKTQAFQNGIDARRYTDFSKKTSITTDIFPNTPVDLDIDFLVESPDDPITFMVSTWGRSKIVFQEEVTPSDIVSEK